MKRTAALAFLLSLLLAANAFAEETRQRYMVALKSPFARGGFKALKQTIDAEATLHNVVGFRSFDGFAADLSDEELALVRASPEVVWVETVVERHALELRDPHAQTIPYGVNLVQAPAAWAAARTGEVNIVVMDTGVDYTHPDLAPLWAGGTNTISGQSTDPMDDHGHGTHVAGTIAASNNHFGVVGVAGVSGIRLWGVKVMKPNSDGTASGNLDWIVAAIDWVIAKKNQMGGRWVLNLSLGGSEWRLSDRQVLDRAMSLGIVVVAASGNDSEVGVPHAVSYPAAYPGVISVGAVDRNSTIASFSNQGPELDLVAPGVGVLSSLPKGRGSLSIIAASTDSFEASPLVGSKQGSLTGEYIFCGLGKPSDFPPTVAGRIALIKRGELKFYEKVRNALAAGALAAVIFNHDLSAIGWTLLEPDPLIEAVQNTATFPWPITLGISKTDGEKLAAAGSGTITLTNVPDDYGDSQGTSMASPHVAGAAALLWAIAPTATPEQIVTALTSTARDLGTAGQDSVFGFGLIDVNAAAHQLAPAAFTIPQPQGPTTGRRFGRRGR